VGQPKPSSSVMCLCIPSTSVIKLLFLTGGFGTAHDFDNLAPRFADCFRVLGLTRRGAGESDKPESGYDTGTLVEDIKQFLDVMQIYRVHLIGYSLAGDEITRF